MKNQKIILKELIKKEIKNQLKEDIIDRWLDKLFDRALEFRVKNEPTIKKLKGDIIDAIDNYRNDIIKKYGSIDKAPGFEQTMLKRLEK